MDCSADEILCMEVRQAKSELNSWLSELAADCTSEEVKLISDTVVAMKAALRRLKTLEQ